MPKPLDPAVDDLGVNLADRVVVEPQFLDHAGAEVLDQDVEAGRELEQQVAAFFGAEVDRDAALVAVPGDEVLGVLDGAALPGEAAAGIAHSGPLHLDHVCAQPGQGLGA